MIEKLYTVEEVAELASVTGRTIRNYLKSGRLVGRKIGGQWRFPEAEVQRLLNGTEPPAEYPDDSSYDSPAPAQASISEEDDFAPLAEEANTVSFPFDEEEFSVSESGILFDDTPAQDSTPLSAFSSEVTENAPSKQPYYAKPAPLPNAAVPPASGSASSQYTHSADTSGFGASSPAAQPQTNYDIPRPSYDPPPAAPPQAVPTPVPAQPTYTQQVFQQPPPAYTVPDAGGLYTAAGMPPAYPQGAAPLPGGAFESPIAYPAMPGGYTAPGYQPAPGAPAYPQAPTWPAPGYYGAAPQAAPPDATPRSADGEAPAAPSGPVLGGDAADTTPKPQLSDVGKRVLKYISEVHDCSRGPQMCTVIDLHQSLSSAKVTSERLAEIADQESVDGALCQCFVEFDDRFFLARYTLFGTTTFLLRCLKLLG